MKKKTPFLIVLLAGAAWPLAAQAPAPSPAPVTPPSPAAAEAAPEGDSPSFPSQVDVVTVDVVVTDKKGTPITGLTQKDFQVVEEGNVQPITSFESVLLPATASEKPAPRPRVSSNLDRESQSGRSFVIVFDDVHLSPLQAQRAKAAVAQFLKTGVREGDRVSLVATGGGAWWSTRMEAGRDELIALLKRLDGRYIPDMSPERMSDSEAMRIHVYHDAQVEQRVSRRFETYGVAARQSMAQDTNMYMGGDPYVQARATDVYFQSVSRNRITLEVIQRILTSLAAAKGRKSVILVSEGFIYDPNLDEFKQAIQASRRGNAAMYFLDVKGLGGLPTYFTAEFGPPIDSRDIGAAFLDTMQEAEGAESLAADSGGFTVKNTNDLGKGIQRIADESRSYYLLGYVPSNTARDGRFRKIQVKVPGRKGLTIRARRGYYAPVEAGQVAKKPSSFDPDIQAALDSPYQEQAVPLRTTSYVFDETLLGKASAIVAADVDVSKFAFEEKDGRFQDTIDFLIVVAHRETGEFYRYDQKIEMNLLAATRERLARTWFPIVRDFELAPGGYQAKIVVRDQNSGRLGTVIHEFEVPELSAFRTSTPVITDTLNPDPENTGTPRPAIIVRRTFAPESMFFASFDVYGAAKDKPTGMPRVSANYTVRRADGTVVLDTAPTQIKPTSLGKLSRIVGTQLPPEATGDLEFVLSVKDEITGKTLEVKEPFTVAGPPAAAAANAPSE
ncbi:MAG TPA: VWA domain-containing protein [Vicinamibacteria bacterium]|nr:VWA domain-containing protein [Vicinamibacteria bacterium]